VVQSFQPEPSQCCPKIVSQTRQRLSLEVEQGWEGEWLKCCLGWVQLSSLPVGQLLPVDQIYNVVGPAFTCLLGVHLIPLGQLPHILFSYVSICSPVVKVCIVQRRYRLCNFDAFYIFSITFSKSPVCNFQTFQSGINTM
jgi:hypothetical protein